MRPGLAMMNGLFVAVLAAGCGDGNDGRPRATVSPGVTPSATPVPTPTTPEVIPTRLPIACVDFCVGTCDIDGQRCVDCVAFEDFCSCRCVPGEIVSPCFDDGSQDGCGGTCETGPCRLGGPSFTSCGCPAP